MKNAIASKKVQAAVVVGTVVLAVVMGLENLAGAAGFTGTPITSGFAAAQTSLITYMGLAVALVIALLLIGAGIRFLVKWVKHAVRAN